MKATENSQDHRVSCGIAGCVSASAVLEVRINGRRSTLRCRKHMMPYIGDLERAAQLGLSVLVQVAA